MTDKKVKVEEEEVDEEVVKEFEQALQEFGDNKNRHEIPDFLKNSINPEEEAERILSKNKQKKKGLLDRFRKDKKNKAVG